MRAITKAFVLLIFCVALLLGAYSCEIDTTASTQGADIFVSSGEVREYNVMEFMSIIKNEFGVNIDQQLIPVIQATGLDDMIVRFVPITYNTVNPLGQPTLASGCVLYPVNRTPKGVIDVMPFGYMANTQAASENGLSTEQALVFMNYIIITPDFLDAGVSKRAHTSLPLGEDAPGEDTYHPLMNMDNSGRVAYDMHLAAAQYFEKELGQKFPAKTSIFGYSEGGTDALALLRWIDLHDKGNILVDKTFSGGGAHDLIAAFNYLKGKKSQLYPIFPSLLYSIDFWTPDIAIDYTKTFYGPLINTSHEYFFRNLMNRSRGYMSELGPDMTTYLHPDFFEEWDADNEFTKILPYLQYNNASADPQWTPASRIYLYHAVGDKHIPEPCSQSAYEALKAKGCNVSYDRCMDYAEGNDPHLSGAISFFVAACGFFALD